MMFDALNNSPFSGSYIQKTVHLQDWWLTRPQTEDGDTEQNTLGVAGITCTSQQNRAVRSFSSAKILKAHDVFELETVDGVSIILQGYLNKVRTLESGFSSEVFDHFIIGFPPYWEEFFSKTICEDSIEGHGASSLESPREHVIKGGDEVEGNMMTPCSMSIHVDSSTLSKVSSRRLTRSMTKCENIKEAIMTPQSNSTRESTSVAKRQNITTPKVMRSMTKCENVEEATVTPQSNSKRESTLMAKRQKITSPKVTRSTSTLHLTPPIVTSADKGSKKRYASGNILSPESLKRTRSGRKVLPSLEFWRNQTAVYDSDRQITGVQEGLNH